MVNIIKELDALDYESAEGTTLEDKIDNGYGITYTYNSTNKVLTKLDADGAERGLAYTVKYNYDALDRVTEEINAKGNVTIYYYDENGNLAKKTVKADTTSEEKTVATSTYNLVGEALSEGDGNGVITTYKYNNFGKVKIVSYAGDSSIEAYYIIHQYDVLGRVVRKVDSRGKVIVVTYDNEGRELSTTVQNEEGTEKVATSNTYDNNGNKLSETDGNGTRKTYTYDSLNNLLSSTIVVNGVKQKTSYTYDKNGNKLTETNWLGNTTTYVYDPLNRVIEKIDANGKTIEKLEYNINGTQSKSIDALGNVKQYFYDKNKRLIKIIDAAGVATYESYDEVGNIESKTDGNGNITKYQYDYLNRLVKVTVSNNGIDENTCYTYDGNGNMLTQTDGKGNVTTYQYNVGNKVSKKISSGENEETYTYYGDGLLKTKVDRNGVAAEYIYDIFGRKIEEKVGDSVVKYTYDNNNNILTITNSEGTTTRTYDELNRVTSKTVPYIGKTTYDYDVTEGIENLEDGFYGEITIDPKGNKVIKIYDKVGRLAEVRAGEDITKYSYYDNGSLQKVTLSNGYSEEYTYNEDNTLKLLENKNAEGTVIESFSYTYDGAKNILTKIDCKGTTTYAYDSLNRLWKVTEPTGKVTSYLYDEAGNRASETVTEDSKTTLNTYSYDGRNRLITITTEVDGATTEVVDYTYDNNGNQLSKVETTYVDGTITYEGITTYSYDVYNQLIEINTANGVHETYTYNSEGYRDSKTSNDKVIRYLYEGDKVILEVDGENSEKARSVYGNKLISRTINGENLYYLYNGHGDVTKLVNGEGKEVASYYYDAFGEIVESSGEADNPIRYAGYQYDEATGLYYLNARMYDPTVARFLQEDTYTGDVKDPLSLNLYTYCHNNPLIYDDLTGHSIKDIWNNVKDTAKAGWKSLTGAVKSFGKGVKEFWDDPAGKFEEWNVLCNMG